MISMNVKYLRNKLSLTQEELAEKIGVTRQSVAKWEAGDSLPDIKKCMEMAYLLEVSLDAFVNMVMDENAKEFSNENFCNERYVFGIVKVGERGQVVIPKQARNLYNVNAGDKLLVLGDSRGMALAKIDNITDSKFGG